MIPQTARSGTNTFGDDSDMKAAVSFDRPAKHGTPRATMVPRPELSRLSEGMMPNWLSTDYETLILLAFHKSSNSGINECHFLQDSIASSVENAAKAYAYLNLRTHVRKVAKAT